MEKLKRRNLLVAILSFSLIFGLGACSKEDSTAFEDSDEITNYVKIVSDQDKAIIIRLEPEEAPITVENFQKLVESGFYDGLSFHRIVPGFVVQGGCPKGDGTGGPGYYIKGEFAANGVDNKIAHDRGTVSMARSQAYDSAGSQFFICLDKSSVQHLDGNYAAFGEVISGMDYVDEMVEDYQSGKNPKPLMKSVSFVKPA